MIWKGFNLNCSKLLSIWDKIVFCECTGAIRGGTKEAFAGGVAERLIRLQNKKYDLFF
ncbi:MAG: hypothetical protein VXZ21_05365 [Bacteroidota bacterium]|nr:hypothetical protein [Bacteroidota bacterium]